MTKTFTSVLIIVLLLSAAYAIKTYFEDDALERVEFQLDQTKKSLNLALQANETSKQEIEHLKNRMTQFQLQVERFQNEMDIVNLKQERLKVTTSKQRQTIDSLLKLKRNRMMVLMANDKVFD